MGTPIPRRENETKGTGAGPIITYRLSPEEIAALAPAKPIPRSHHKPLNLPERKTNEEENDLAKYEKDEYLGLLASGKDRIGVARLWGIQTIALKQWLKKWEISDPAQEEIALADYQQRKKQATGSAPAEQQVTTPSHSVTDASKSKDEVDRLRAEVEMLRELRAGEKRQSLDTEKRLQKTIDELNASLEEYLRTPKEPGIPYSVAKQKDAEIDSLRVEVADLREIRATELTEHSELVSRLENTIGQLNDRCEQAEGTLDAIQAERMTVAGTITVLDDPVNHPAHYTAGGIECIDAIEAATIGLPGGLAYNTGAAIKYLWRWFRKNGVEDLKKARWYIDRLIGEVEANDRRSESQTAG